ncbi:MAG: radical SAM protein [Deltaproteobacteria bacterium]|nr:radical SAM protein [Deltaproteobacteria bacterium]
MARVAFVKLFTGLNLGVSQLSGELQLAGHQSLMIFFKDYRVVPQSEVSKYETPELCGTWVAGRGRLMNCNAFTPITEREYQLLIETLRDFRPDLIGFSLPTVPMREVAAVTQRLKREFDVPIIWGGAGPTLEPEKCLTWADLVCVGEGEELIVELAEAIDAGRELTSLRGLAYKRGDEVVRTPARPIGNLDDIAFPDFAESRTVHINDDRLRRNLYMPNLGRQYHIMTQRGCPFSCSFCIESVYQDMWGKKDSLRRRSVDLVIEELVQAKRRHNIGAVMFWDDVFTTNPRWLREFAPRYKAEVGLPFWCYTYPRTTRKDDLLILKDAGLRSVGMGIQSGSQQVLAEYNRPVATRRAIDAARDVIDCGLTGTFELITRGEFETEDTCRETFEFLLDFPAEFRTVGFYPMIKFPTYGYTRKVADQAQRSPLSDADYEYWHRAYLLTRTNWPRRFVRAVANNPLVRRFPTVMNPLLPKDLPFFYFEHHAIDLEAATIGTSEEATAQPASPPEPDYVPLPAAHTANRSNAPAPGVMID